MSTDSVITIQEAMKLLQQCDTVLSSSKQLQAKILLYRQKLIADINLMDEFPYRSARAYLTAYDEFFNIKTTRDGSTDTIGDEKDV